MRSGWALGCNEALQRVSPVQRQVCRMREGRLRRLVVPDWPPKSVSEALLLVLCAVGARILLDLWLPREQVIPLFSAPADQALVLVGELLRWSVVVLV